MKADGLIVVGGSYAALNIALSARDAGYGGPIRILSAEDRLPYYRPPLSKGYFKGEVAAGELPIKSGEFYRDKDIEVALNTRVTRIDRIDRSVETDTGDRIPYDHLALALGTNPRRLAVPGSDAAGIHYLKSQADADAIRSALDAAQSVVIVGGGFIGLELAASLSALGKPVRIIEAMDRVVARAGTAVLSEFLTDIHARNGVEILCSTTVASFDVTGGRVSAVVDSQGNRHAADLAVVGIGVVPNDDIARACGLVCHNGIEVDEFGTTSDGFIFASGDCTSFQSRFGGESPIRLECVQNATEQARATGAAIAGKRRAYDAVPWFWSDQYDSKIQMAGLAAGYDQAVRREGKAAGAFSVLYFRDERLIAADTVNAPAEHLALRRLLMAEARVSPAQAADPGFELRKALEGPAD